MSLARIIETDGFGLSVVPGTLSWDDLVPEGAVMQEMAARSGSCCRAVLSASPSGSCSGLKVPGGQWSSSSLGLAKVQPQNLPEFGFELIPPA